MDELNWVDFSGFLFGVVGAITGCTSVIVSYKNQKKIQQVKSLDLRIELRRTINEIRALLLESDSLLPRAFKSRLAIHAATGKLRSGATANWHTEHKKDLNSLEEIGERFSRAEKFVNIDSYETLEQKLDSIDQLKREIVPIVYKYQDSLKEDDKVRESIREQHEKFA